jgi:hypothetical protein
MKDAEYGNIGMPNNITVFGSNKKQKDKTG